MSLMDLQCSATYWLGYESKTQPLVSRSHWSVIEENEPFQHSLKSAMVEVNKENETVTANLPHPFLHFFHTNKMFSWAWLTKIKTALQPPLQLDVAMFRTMRCKWKCCSAASGNLP